MKQKYWLPLVFAAVFAGGIWVGSLLDSRHATDTPARQKLAEVFDIIEENYVDYVDLDSLVEMTIPVMLNNLDPHSSYIPASDLQEVNTELEGKFSGIGISFQVLNDTLNVLEVLSDGPSEKGGVMPGDRIIEVDDTIVAGRNIPQNDIVHMLRGEKGTHVKIKVKRGNQKELITFELIRDDIPVESVDASYMIDPEVGYIRISKFARNTFDEFFQALSKLKLQGAQKYIIDLRFNGGGFMEPAVLMANEFLNVGDVIVSTRGRNREDNKIIPADGTGAFRDADLAVLVNEFTASASEIFSGAIQDNDRGWIIGRRSFGKGLVQRPISLPDSSEVRLTIQRYYTPSGRSIQKDYTRGHITDYDLDIVNRYVNGEILNEDSIKLNKDLEFSTAGGRKVYGGGGIMPDLFVPEDTAHVTAYFNVVRDQNLLMKFAYEYCDLNRQQLQKATNVDELLKMLPSNSVLLNSFVNFAQINGVNPRYNQINISAPLIVNQLKALIARNIMGLSGYYEVYNKYDSTVQKALEKIKSPVIEEE
ncbi:MAG: S41 family peptidase [Clostridium sp.]|nr:S41 family peptidase [Clostridium sp.]